MKPPVFAYAAPASVEDCTALLARHGPDAKVIAGGQSLMPLLNLRMVRPEVVVDIGRVPALAEWRVEGGRIRIGATVRQRSLLSDAALARHLPLMAEAIGFVGHPATRSRGTIVGSLCHADPAAELPVCALLLDAELHLRKAGGARTLAADAFFRDALATAIEEGELVEAVSVPQPPPGAGFAFAEIARRHGDFALVCAAAMAVAEGGRVTRGRVVLGGVGGRPRLFTWDGDGDGFAGFAKDVAAAVSPATDLHATAEYRRAMAAVLVESTLQRAAARAGAGR